MLFMPEIFDLLQTLLNHQPLAKQTVLTVGGLQ